MIGNIKGMDIMTRYTNAVFAVRKNSDESKRITTS